MSEDLKSKLLAVAESHFEKLYEANNDRVFYMGDQPDYEKVDATERARWLVDEIYDEVRWKLLDAFSEFGLQSVYDDG